MISKYCHHCRPIHSSDSQPAMIFGNLAGVTWPRLELLLGLGQGVQWACGGRD